MTYILMEWKEEHQRCSKKSILWGIRIKMALGNPKSVKFWKENKRNL